MIGSVNLTTAQVLDAFADAIASHGGRVSETFDDGRRLFVRSILPRAEDVRPRDQVQPGVALRATQEGVRLYPFVFRQVCRNGAIMTTVLDDRSVGALEWEDPAAALDLIREGVEACCEPAWFKSALGSMRTASLTPVNDLAINLLAHLGRLGHLRGRLQEYVEGLLFRERNGSQFGVANAVTATARDIRDPEVRWDLEELGGAIMLQALPRSPIPGGGRARSSPGMRAKALACEGAL